MNGGTCYSNNLFCQCPENFAGDRCQYPIEICVPKKIGFNGNYKCSGTAFDLTCSISCPDGISFEFPPEEAYSCNFETEIFTPADVPKCVYGKVLNN